MGIKYHQYGCGNDYGDDHYLTDNWNPDYDYGSQYVEVYFNINTPSYMHDKDPSAFGFASDEARDEWYAAASKVIASFDILEDSGYNVENSAEKRAYLYPHPQQISGVILKNDVRKVAEAIERMSPSSIRWVDLYDTVYVISDEAYEKYLIFKDESLKKIANILYNLSTDMDADDYADIYDIEIQEIEKSIYKLKESHDILYPVLVSIAETHKDMFNFCKDQN